jgi:hypothetical protein
MGPTIFILLVLRPPGATVFSQIWKDPDNPSWSDYIAFPEGSAVFKILLTDATDDELPFMAGSPTWKIVGPFSCLLTC